MGINWFSIQVPFGKEIEVSSKRKTQTHQIYGSTVQTQCISNGKVTMFWPKWRDSVTLNYTLLWLCLKSSGWKIKLFPMVN